MKVLDLDQMAVEILLANDRGGYTQPTARLYPYQWNWDSALSALGFAEFDLDRAWRELETLFEGQWPNGMVPHIIFRSDDPDYFPGPTVWGSGTEPPSSGHSQPAVATTVALDLYRKDPKAGEPRLRALFPKLFAWHDWFHRARDPDGLGVIIATHPWETGRDNSPDWDAAMAAIVPTGVQPYVRRDTAHVDAEMRPTQEDYDRFLYMVEWGRRTGWAHEQITREGPFAVADPGLTFILLRADRDLQTIATLLGANVQANRIAAWIDAAEAGSEYLWSGDLGAYVARDVRTGAFGQGVSSVAFLSFYAGLLDSRTEGPLLATLDRIVASARYMVPSYDPGAQGYDPKRYWRGPVWGVVNYLIGRGLEECGHEKRAERVRTDTRRLIENAGFQEYYDPSDGAGCGGGDFSWTAAVWLSWAGGAAG